MIKKIVLSFFSLSLLFSCTTKSDFGGKKLYMWLDSEANFERLSYPDSIDFYISKIEALGFTDVVVDVKNIMGETLYSSEIAPYMEEWEGVHRDIDYDMLGLIQQACKKYKLGCYASLNVFAGGHNFYDRGIIYGDKAKWQSIMWWEGKYLPIREAKWKYNGMLNPALPEVQEYQISILEECLRRYPDLDGIIFDRVRYDDITSDFSEFSHKDFEKYLGQTVENFPECVMRWSFNPNKKSEKNPSGSWEWKLGPMANLWFEYRSMVIHDFIEKACARLKSINPKCKIGDYTGAWYPTYYYLGVNWANKEYDPSQRFSWATENYKNSGYAHLLDLYMTGLYYTAITKLESAQLDPTTDIRSEAAMDAMARDDWYSVEGGAEMAAKLTLKPVIGSIYINQYPNDPNRFERAVTQAIMSCEGGMMLFDMSHLVDHGWWGHLENALTQAKNQIANK